ncbi:amidohydrolase [Kribbella sp. NPDC058693]|uniref:amidohydrolase n=1 Tax=Kribbella sp. NPDC058693 TaxID=3346602 RepID=UPI003662AA72
MTVYLNANVVTVDGDFSIAEAFAVSDGRFVAVGTNEEVAQLDGPVVDLGGRTVLPGFIDAHAHTVHLALDGLADPNLAGLTSVAAITERIGAVAAAAEPGAWIVTSSIGEPPDYFGLPEGLAEGRWPTRADLDAVAPDNPVHIPTPPFWPHPAILNTRALELLGVTRDTPDQPDLRIERDESGEPTGVIHGLIFYNARNPLVQRLFSLLPATSREDRRDAIAAALERNLANGLTTIYEGHGNNPSVLEASDRPACRVVGTYEVPVGRVNVTDWLTTVGDAAGEGTGDDHLRIRGVTVSLDAPMHFGGAMMSEPFLDPHGELGNGSSVLSTAELAELARLAVRNDLRLNVLATGDAACEIAVSALETVHRETPLTSRAWVVQHFHHVTQDQIARLAAMGVVAQVCAGVDYGRGETYVNRLPSDQWEHVTPVRWWLDAGVPTALASDGAHPPLFHLWAALTRTDGRSRRSLLTPAKTISRAEAIRGWTADAAIVLGVGDRLGSIEPGKLADFVVLDRDILTCPVDEIREATVLRTVLAGRDPDAHGVESSVGPGVVRNESQVG